LLNFGHFVKKISLDVEYFRSYDLCVNENDTFSCIAGLSTSSNCFVAGTEKKNLELWDLEKNCLSSNINK
jgi:hypothetical protein